MFNRRNERDVAGFALGIFALGAAAAGMPATREPVDAATVIAALNAAVSIISADACWSTPECAAGSRIVDAGAKPHQLYR